MKKDIILSGVGGQGILTIATIIGEAATNSGLMLKQAEVHGMSQRGGDVQSNLRLSDKEIASDLIALGCADMIISLEPMEALRYLPYLNKNVWIITSSSPIKNIPNYPEEETLLAELKSFANVILLDVEKIAKENNMPKTNSCKAKNFGELIYKKKIDSAFSKEMNRSIIENIKCFIDEK